jgi:hypothetical protein
LLPREQFELLPGLSMPRCGPADLSARLGPATRCSGVCLDGTRTRWIDEAGNLGTAQRRGVGFVRTHHAQKGSRPREIGNPSSLADSLDVEEHPGMEIVTTRSKRLLPLRIAATAVLLASGAGVFQVVAERHELLAAYPGLSEKVLATMITLTFLGSVALAFLAFLRQRFGLWIVLACAAIELALETWAGLSPLYLLRLPVAAALILAAAYHAWPELRRVD